MMRKIPATLTILISVLLAANAFFVLRDEDSPTGPAAMGGDEPGSHQTPKNDYNSGQANPAQAFLLPVSRLDRQPVRDFTFDQPEIDAKSAAIIDVNSGQPLFVKDPNRRLPIASVTKLMTAAMILDNLDLDEIYTVRIEDINVDGLGADLQKDERLSGQDLFKMMLIESSNDAAMTFATAARRRGIDLVSKMNEKARELGMADTRFSDPAGLADQNSFSTANDLVRLVQYINGYTKIWETLKIRETEVVSVDGSIRHYLINTNKLLDQMPNIIGGKTGYTDNALGTMVLYVKTNHGRDELISIVLGSPDRFGATKALIDWVQKAYTWQ